MNSFTPHEPFLDTLPRIPDEFFDLLYKRDPSISHLMKLNQIATEHVAQYSLAFTRALGAQYRESLNG